MQPAQPPAFSRDRLQRSPGVPQSSPSTRALPGTPGSSSPQLPGSPRWGTPHRGAFPPTVLRLLGPRDVSFCSAEQPLFRRTPRRETLGMGGTMGWGGPSRHGGAYEGCGRKGVPGPALSRGTAGQAAPHWRLRDPGKRGHLRPGPGGQSPGGSRSRRAGRGGQNPAGPGLGDARREGNARPAGPGRVKGGRRPPGAEAGPVGKPGSLRRFYWKSRCRRRGGTRGLAGWGRGTGRDHAATGLQLRSAPGSDRDSPGQPAAALGLCPSGLCPGPKLGRRVPQLGTCHRHREPGSAASGDPTRVG